MAGGCNPPLLILLSIAITCLSQTAWAGPKTASATLPARVDQNTQPDTEVSIEINSEAQSLTKSKAIIDLDIPHTLDKYATCSCYAYPYPMVPQRRKAKQAPLTANNEQIRKAIQNTAYTRRNTRQDFYPFLGWRWQQAYHRALARSGMRAPLLLPGLYIFTNNIFPYVKEEVLRSNEFEEKRQKRYDDAGQDYTDNRADAETDATRRGVGPVFIKFDKFGEHGVRRAMISLPPGQWWIVSTLKVPGLTYYWQEPLSVHEGSTEHAVLNEDSALLIEGAW